MRRLNIATACLLLVAASLAYSTVQLHPAMMHMDQGMPAAQCVDQCLRGAVPQATAALPLIVLAVVVLFLMRRPEALRSVEIGLLKRYGDHHAERLRKKSLETVVMRN